MPHDSPTSLRPHDRSPVQSFLQNVDLAGSQGCCPEPATNVGVVGPLTVPKLLPRQRFVESRSAAGDRCRARSPRAELPGGGQARGTGTPSVPRGGSENRLKLAGAPGAGSPRRNPERATTWCQAAAPAWTATGTWNPQGHQPPPAPPVSARRPFQALALRDPSVVGWPCPHYCSLPFPPLGCEPSHRASTALDDQL